MESSNLLSFREQAAIPHMDVAKDPYQRGVCGFNIDGKCISGGNKVAGSRGYRLASLGYPPGQAAVESNCYTLYGSVTISASFTPLSQAILVDTLDRHHSDSPTLRNSVISKQPFIPQTKNHHLVADAWAELGMNRLNSVIEDIEQDQRAIPPLMRYYVTLGAKFSAFQVEESFNNAIYCLLRVDMKSLPKRYKKRFFGGLI